MFDILDKKQDTFGIQTYGISITTLEEVFLRVEDDDILYSMEKKSITLAVYNVG